MAADTLTGHSDPPAHLPGTGPLDPDTARNIAAGAPWRRMVVDPDLGTLLHRDTHIHPPTTAPSDQPRADPRLPRMLTDPITTAPHPDRSRYRPTARLRAFIHTRDTTCLGPACPHPTTGTQIDHTINHHERDAHDILGLTLENNLGSLCERTHNAKTHGDWHPRQPAPGTFTWTSPTGRVYHRQARPLLPGWHTRHRPQESEQAERPRDRPPPTGRPPPM